MGAEQLCGPGLYLPNHVFMAELFPPTVAVTEMVQLLNPTSGHVDSYANV